MREAVYVGLRELMKEHPEIIVIDTDVGEATRVKRLAGEFKERVINIGITEQSSFGIAAGLSLEGLKPYVVMFSMFALRGIEIVRQSIGYPELNVTIIGTHAGVSVGEDGPTHQCIEDIGCFRAISRFRILSPADRYEAISVIRESYKIRQPSYIRLARQQFGYVYSEIPEFKPFRVIEDYGDDFTIISTGIGVYEAKKALNRLKKDNLKGKLINVVQIKPLDKEILKFISEKVICVEDHNIHGGLFSAISEEVSQGDMKVKILPIGVKDRYGKSGKPYDVLKYFKLDHLSIYEEVKKWLRYF